MGTRLPTPLFVDTSALYARLDESDENHERARAIFEGIRSGKLGYRPLYVTNHVLCELLALTMRYKGTADAIDEVDRLRESSLFVLVHPDAEAIDAATRQLFRYDDQPITLVDHLTGVLAENHDIEAVFTFDGDFRTLDFLLVPEDVRTW